MSLLVRKVDKGKWFKTDILREEDVCADAITNCLKTKENALSVWRVESEEDLDEAVLAIVSEHQHLEAIDVVPLISRHLTENGIDCVPSDGSTPIKDLVGTHVDLAHLTYRTLGIVAYHIADRIRDRRIERYTKGMQKEILRRAIDAGRLNVDDLYEPVRNKL